MSLEERLMHSLSSPQAREALQESVEAALRKVGWNEEEMPQATHLLMEKLAPYPAINNGVTDKGILEH
jgi:hypothetical protein